MSALRHPDHSEDDSGIEVIELTPEEGMALFDRRARELVGMSGEEFLAHFDAGTFPHTTGPDGEDRNYNRLIMSLPFAGRSHQGASLGTPCQGHKRSDFLCCTPTHGSCWHPPTRCDNRI
jgi:hypothetical protein